MSQERSLLKEIEDLASDLKPVSWGLEKLANEMGFELKSSPALGLRSQRYVMILEDGIVKNLLTEPKASGCTVTCADHIVDIL